VPIIEQPLLLFAASDALAVLGLDLQGSLAADVREVRRNRALLVPPPVTFTMTSGIRLTVREICSICAPLNRAGICGPARP
jgi:hypothetical protein